MLGRNRIQHERIYPFNFSDFIIPYTQIYVSTQFIVCLLYFLVHEGFIDDFFVNYIFQIMLSPCKLNSTRAYKNQIVLTIIRNVLKLGERLFAMFERER